MKSSNKLLTQKITADYKYVFYKTDLDEKSAFKIEKQMIKKYGRVIDKTGTLFNFTLGGEGVSGYMYTKNTILKRYPKSRKFVLYDNHLKKYTRLFISLGDCSRELNIHIPSIFDLLSKKCKTILKGRYSLSEFNMEKLHG